MGFAARENSAFGNIGMNYYEVSKTGQMGAGKSRHDLHWRATKRVPVESR
jgi:hypothetical protein